MEKTVKFSESEDRPLAGYWSVAEGGHIWDYDAEVSLLGGEDERSQREAGPPWLVAADGPGAELRRYPVLRKRGLLDQFVKLGRSPTPERVLSFADRWGWLTEGAAVDSRGRGGVRAEPLSLWQEESAGLAELYRVWEAILAFDDRDSLLDRPLRDARRFLETHIEWRDAAVDFRGVPAGARQSRELGRAIAGRLPARERIASAGTRPDVYKRFNKGDLVEPARFFLCTVINSRLRARVNMSVLPFLDSRIRFFPSDLITAIYMKFAFEVSRTRDRERICENDRCPNGGYFRHKMGNQRFCDKRCREQAGYHRRKASRSSGEPAADQ